MVVRKKQLELRKSDLNKFILFMHLLDLIIISKFSFSPLL